ncbi:MAG: hypothetical protein K6G61_05065 [Solobacterium sp.]|nr:hypothetical protein [Solobacterium sp.]
MKRLFLAFLSVFMMTACSSAPAAEGSKAEEAPAEEETQEQAETPAEETPEQEETEEEMPEESDTQGAIYSIADTTYVSFEIDELSWTMLPGGDLNNVGYAFSSGTGSIQVYTREKTDMFERNGLAADASLKELMDAVKARLESDGKTEYTEYTETEIDGHP